MKKLKEVFLTENALATMGLIILIYAGLTGDLISPLRVIWGIITVFILLIILFVIGYLMYMTVRYFLSNTLGFCSDFMTLFKKGEADESKK